MSYHEICIVGHLGKDPEMRYSPGGQAVTNFPVAANRRYRNSQGELVKETIWFQVTAWERQAENANQYLHRSSQVMVKGRLTPDPDTGSPRIWERRDGSPGTSFEVIAREIIYLSGKDGTNGNEPPGDDKTIQRSGSVDEDIPF